MPTNSYNRIPVRSPVDRNQGRTGPRSRCRPSLYTFEVPPVLCVGRNGGRADHWSRRRSSLTLFMCAAAMSASPALARKERETFQPSAPLVAPVQEATGAIFRDTGYAPLTSGARASRVGDLLTIVLTERTAATKASSSGTDRTGSISLTPPVTGPLNLFQPSDVNSSGAQSFKGKGESAQSNALSGEVSVTVAALYPNGTMLVRGEKAVTLSRGEERVQISGIVRPADISPDNRIASTRVADARIRYIGKGHVSDASRPGWLQRFFAKISPF